MSAGVGRRIFGSAALSFGQGLQRLSTKVSLSKPAAC